MKGNREESEEGTGRVTSCVGPDPGELGRLKRLTGYYWLTGPNPFSDFNQPNQLFFQLFQVLIAQKNT